jgi:hypothetical protein
MTKRQYLARLKARIKKGAETLKRLKRVLKKAVGGGADGGGTSAIAPGQATAAMPERPRKARPAEALEPTPADDPTTSSPVPDAAPEHLPRRVPDPILTQEKDQFGLPRGNYFPQGTPLPPRPGPPPPPPARPGPPPPPAARPGPPPPPELTPQILEISRKSVDQTTQLIALVRGQQTLIERLQAQQEQIGQQLQQLAGNVRRTIGQTAQRQPSALNIGSGD